MRSAIEGVFCARDDAAVVREFLRRPGLTLHYNGTPFFEPPLMM